MGVWYEYYKDGTNLLETEVKFQLLLGLPDSCPSLSAVCAPLSLSRSFCASLSRCLSDALLSSIRQEKNATGDV